MRELVISRIKEYTENGEYLDDYGINVDEADKTLDEMSDVELLDLLQEIVFGG